MAKTYTPCLYLPMPAAANTAWKPDHDLRAGVIDHLFRPDGCLFVDPNFTTANLGNSLATDRRHYPTIQEAIDRVATMPSLSATIYVGPSNYYENLTFSTDGAQISLVGLSGGIGHAYHKGASILGVPSAEQSLLTFSHSASGDYSRVRFSGFVFNNSYSGATQNPSIPFLVDYNGNIAPYTWSNLTFKDCIFRMQQYNGDGVASVTWPSAFDIYGMRLKVSIIDCQLHIADYGGGSSLGSISQMFKCRGEMAASYSNQLVIWKSLIRHGGDATDSARVLFDVDNKVHLEVCQCPVQNDIGGAVPWLADGGNSTWIYGVEETGAETYLKYGNLSGACPDFTS